MSRKSSTISLFVLLIAIPILTAIVASRARAETATETDTTLAQEPGPEERRALLEARLLPLAERSPEAQVTPLEVSSWITRQPATTVEEGTLAFQSDRSGGGDIYSYNLADNQEILLVAGPGSDTTAMWSPDGRSLLFASYRDGDFDIYLRSAEGTVTNLTDNSADDIHPDWAPDSSHLIFASDRSGYFQIYRMAPGDDFALPLTNIAGTHFLHPRYSPDGTRIAFMRASVLAVTCLWNWDIWLMAADGTNHEKVTTHLYGDVYPDWTLDGSSITYAACRDLLTPDFDLYVTRLSDNETSRWNDWSGSNEWGAVFSPSGAYLAFNSDIVGNNEVFMMPIDSSSPVNLTENPASDLFSSWQALFTGDSFTISGRVVDSVGVGIEGVSVQVLDGPATSTVVDGSYRMDDLPAGTYTVQVSKTDFSFEPATMIVNLPPDAVHRNFVGHNCTAMTRDLPPLLLVAGWSGSAPGGMDKDDQLNHLQNAMSQSGYVPGCNLFYAPATTPYENLKRNGERLADYVCQVADSYASLHSPWDGRLNIIGYSYGGLRARALLENEEIYWPTGLLSCENGRQVRVPNLFTLGTPHGGEWPNLPFSAYIGARAIVNSSGPHLPALWQMLPPVRAFENLLAEQPDGVCYHIVAGDARQQVATSLSTLAAVYRRWPPAQEAPNDFAVHQSSSFSLWWYLGRYEDSYYVPTTELHGQVPWELDPLGHLTSYVNPERTYLKHVYPYLDSQSCPTNLIPPLSRPVMSRQLAAPQETGSAAPLMDIAAGPLAIDSQLTGDFTLEQAGPTHISLYWMDGDLSFAVADPSGRQLQPSDANVDYLEVDTGFGLMASYQVTTTLQGTWHYTITTGSDIPQQADYRLLALPSQPISVNGAVPGWVRFNAPATLTATVTYSRSQPFPDSSVTARVQAPDGSSQTIVLHDDGVHQDGAAGDGVYGALYENTGQPGLYGVQIEAVGTFAGSSYRRNSVGYFTVTSPAASLVGQYGEEPVDGNGSGRYNWLDITVAVEVAEVGNYGIAADLVAGNTYLDHAQVQETLSAGRHTLTLRFDGERIRQAQQDGPYTVANLVLFDERDVTLLVEVVDSAYTTTAYSYEAFGHSPRLFLPVLHSP